MIMISELLMVCEDMNRKNKYLNILIIPTTRSLGQKLKLYSIFQSNLLFIEL